MSSSTSVIGSEESCVPAGWARRRRRGGFTIIEILIAIVVLVLGITGIIALFPTAIESGNQTVEDSYAAAITQSVVDAVTVGVREARYTYVVPAAGRGTDTVWTYFLFNHDGVVDAAPGEPELYDSGSRSGPDSAAGADEIWRRDYCVLLPQAVGLDPNTDVLQEPVFIYPVPQASSRGNGERAPGSLGSVVDNMAVSRWQPTGDGQLVPWIPGVYHLGVYREPLPSQPALPSGLNPGDVRLEFRGEQLQIGTQQVETIAIDPYPSYSFAFTMQRARIDTDRDGRITNNDAFSNSLFQVKVMVFKNFDDDAARQLDPNATGGGNMVVPRTNRPIKEFVTLISL